MELGGRIERTRIEDVPFDAQTGEVLLTPSTARLRRMPAHLYRVQLLAVDAAGERERTGLTQEQFAATFAISLGALRHWERGDRKPRGTALLFSRPDRRYFLREIARAAGTPPSSLQRELAALADAGAITQTREGRQVYYQANAACPIFEELKAIAAKTFGVAGELGKLLAPHASRLRLAFVFGSVAKGSAAPASDIDLLWVGSLSPSELVLALAEAEQRLGRTISVTAYDEEEFSGLLAQENHFLANVFEGPVLWLIGSKETLDELRQAQPRKSRARSTDITTAATPRSTRVRRPRAAWKPRTSSS
ncbi:MAG: nucleotidyltransferase domain-containing protein [Burkholderiales bacterium]